MMSQPHAGCVASAENKFAHEPDDCPHCKRPFEIVAVKFTLLGRNVALFICPGCGLARAETRDEARRKLRGRIFELERMLRELKSRFDRE
jgi:transposase-like protein